jgi:hypothetical protein
MVSLRLAIPAILIAAAVAACITYTAIPSPPTRIEVDRQSQPTAPKVTARPVMDMPTDPQRQAAEDQIAAFQRAAAAILKRAANATASAGADEPLITGRVPLPKRRPILRP